MTMNPIFKCELNYFESPHLSQLYSGFEILKKRGIVEISVKAVSNDSKKPVLQVRLNDQYTLIYDTLDGLNWIDGDRRENLNYFKNNIRADFYFKRSFNQQIIDYAPDNCRVFPLGLNYPISPRHLYRRNVKESFKNVLRNNYFISKYLKINRANIHSENFEFYPAANKMNNILFLARLWDPADVQQDHLKSEREAINNYRVSCMKSCLKEFKQHFTGGLQMDAFSLKYCRELVMPFSLTKRDVYLDTVKQSNICIATTGLHDSIGFKMGEYVAASRAIVSEPLLYALPGRFENRRNYFSFLNEEELLSNIYFLFKNKDALMETMQNNYRYYHHYVRPDILVLNTLLTVSSAS